jgi:hypothetical protein
MKRYLTIITILSLLVLLNSDVNAQFVASGKKHSGMVKIAPEGGENTQSNFAIVPGTINNVAHIVVTAERDGWATLKVRNALGHIQLEQQMAVNAGINKIPVFFVSKLHQGIYSTELRVDRNVYFADLVKD